MRQTPKLTTFNGPLSRTYRCRVEQLESRAMMAADFVDAAVDFVSDDVLRADEVWGVPVGERWACSLPACDLPASDVVDPACVGERTIVDDTGLVFDDSWPVVFEPVDIRVRAVSSATEPGWATCSYEIATDGMALGVSVWASYDCQAVPDRDDDPAVQMSDWGDGWWTGVLSLEPEGAPCESDRETFVVRQTAYEYADSSDELAVVSEWSRDAGGWQSAWAETGGQDAADWSWSEWTDGGAAVVALSFARGAGPSEPSADGSAECCMPTDGDQPAVMLEPDVTFVEPVAKNARSAAFADMSSMAAVAAALQFNSVDTVPFGVGRRRR